MDYEFYPARTVRNEIQLLSVEQKGRLAIVKGAAAMSDHNCDQIQRYKNQTSADLYLWIMSSIPARTVRNEFNCILWNKGAVCPYLVKEKLCILLTEDRI